MAWQQLSLITNASNAAIISAFFEQMGAESVTYLDAEDQPIFEPPIDATPVWPKTQVIALFPESTVPALVKLKLDQELSEIPYHNWTEQTLADQAWERAWLEHFKPLCFANRLWICPTGQERSEPGTVCLTLDPGLAFGTGTHPTTSLCLEWLAGHDLSSLSVIDYGCGSGILAIAALALGAKSVIAVDIDRQALTATQANAEKNQLQDRLLTCLPENMPEHPSDLLIANILAGPLIELAPRLQSLVKTNGQLLLSGLLRDQAEAVCQAYLPSFSFSVTTGPDDWCLLSAARTEAFN